VNPTSTSKPFRTRLRKLATLPLLLPVHAYRTLISPFIAPRCRYYPSCSTYAVDALREYGPVRGSILAAWRVMRCNPFSDGGFDYVADQKLFKSESHSCDEPHKHRGVAA
jgi:putative membrane protein insertion efficiency factor